MVVDVKFIRENPKDFSRMMSERKHRIDVEYVLHLYQSSSRIKQDIQTSQEHNNSLSKCYSIDHVTIVKSNNSRIQTLKSELSLCETELQEILDTTPNIYDPDTPVGDSEKDNVLVRKHGNIPQCEHKYKHHYEMSSDIDFTTAVQMSGSRFSILHNKVAKLARILTNLALDLYANEFQYVETCVPEIVSSDAMYNSGQLPKFAEDAFKLQDGKYLIPTGEVPLVNIAANSIIKELPMRFVTYTQCFRSEAGAAGKDTRGLIRQHQFGKVELVSVVHPDNSDNEFERMLSAVESLLHKLQLPYQIVQLCTGDLGFTAAKTYDIEVWFPAQKKYREVSSCSNCRDFQARRMKARFKDENKKNRLVHTLNGTGLAVGRIIAALLENNQSVEKCIELIANVKL